MGATSPQSLSAPLGANLDRRHSLGGGDDIREVQKAGVPLVLPRQDGLDYFDTHHTADDTLDKDRSQAVLPTDRSMAFRYHDRALKG